MFFRVAKCSSDEPGIFFSELAISTLHVDRVDGFAAYRVFKYRLNGFGGPIDDAVFYLQQTPELCT